MLKLKCISLLVFFITNCCAAQIILQNKKSNKIKSIHPKFDYTIKTNTGKYPLNIVSANDTSFFLAFNYKTGKKHIDTSTHKNAKGITKTSTTKYAIYKWDTINVNYNDITFIKKRIFKTSKLLVASFIFPIGAVVHIVYLPIAALTCPLFFNLNCSSLIINILLHYFSNFTALSSIYEGKNSKNRVIRKGSTSS